MLTCSRPYFSQRILIAPLPQRLRGCSEEGDLRLFATHLQHQVFPVWQHALNYDRTVGHWAGSEGWGLRSLSSFLEQFQAVPHVSSHFLRQLASLEHLEFLAKTRDSLSLCLLQSSPFFHADLNCVLAAHARHI